MDSDANDDDKDVNNNNIYIFYSPKTGSTILKKHRKQTQVNLTNSTARITDYQKI